MYKEAQIINKAKVFAISLDGGYLATYNSNEIKILKLHNGFYELQQVLFVKDIVSLAMNHEGDVLIAGSGQGAAYVFTRAGSNWTQQAILLASDPASGDRFGISVSIASDGNTAIVGAYYKAGSAGTRQGAAYIYTRSGSSWTQQAKLLASDAASNDQFGWSVSIASDGNTAIVGANLKTGSASQQGAAYVFTRAGSSCI